MPAPPDRSPRALGLWAAALGYFLCYVPYSALVKAASGGALGRPVSGVALLPSVVTASLLTMLATITLARWWHFAGTRRVLGHPVPFPGRWTLLSGLCTSAILLTTTLSYAFAGTSIVLMAVVMKAAVLVLAPLVDFAGRRAVRPASWVALGLSLLALGAGLSSVDGGTVSAWAAVDVVVYVLAYFVRLRLMSHLAKSDDAARTLRYFVEEQLTATPAALLAVGLLALTRGAAGAELRHGFGLMLEPRALGVGMLIGALSQGTGIFGGMILLDRRENSFCIPVNRASSVLAGLVATAGLAAWGRGGMPGAGELAGAGLLVGAIAVLGLWHPERGGGARNVEAVYRSR